MSLLSRRQAMAGSLALAAGGLLRPGIRNAGAQQTVLTATTRVIEIDGKPATVLGLEGPRGFGGLALSEGEAFKAGLRNALSEPTLIHWHGQTPPAEQDGVPDLSQPPLASGASYSYDFDNTRTGTHWMHSHLGLQEQRMLAAPLVIRERGAEQLDEQEHVVMLHDFTFRDPEEILAELRKGGGAHAAHAVEGMDQSSSPARLNDVVFDAYLANERTIADPEIVRVEKGGRVRLRIINAAAASNMWIDLRGLAGELIAVDGNEVRAVKDTRFPLAIAQRADIRLDLPSEEGAWPVLFRPEGVGRSAAIVLATANATVSRIGETRDIVPAVDLSLEARLEAAKPLSPEPITRLEMVALTGGGADYVWSLNGKPSVHNTLFTVEMGERIAIMMHNMTTMSHPMHLHGHHFQVIEIDGRQLKGAMRDTVLVPPNAVVTIAFAADNPGNWALHCHHIYHMNAGMMGAIRYKTAA